MRINPKISIIVIFCVIAISILYVARVLQPLESGIRTMLLPGARILGSIGGSVRDSIIPSPESKELIERNKELEARMSSFTVDYVRLRALEEENRALQSLVKFQKDTGYDSVPARIIARSVDPRSATVLIDRGSIDGVETGMAVIVGDGIFVGKITGLRERVATVTLVSDERSRIAAAALGRGHLFGLIEGRGNNVARLTFVPQSEPLDRDDIIVTAGTEEKIPANLVIGVVNDVEGKPTNPFKNASLEPLAKSDSLNIILVLRPSVLRPE
jgi:rod shape-determining protein MreC